jgi:hypothetical protein
MKKKLFALLLIIFLAVVVLGQQQPQTITVWAPYTIEPEKIDTDLNSKIRTEGLEHSKVMWIEHYLTDVYGPRPTGSPNHEAAAKWAVSTMTGWMKNAHLEPWEWGHPGWLPERATGFIISPVKANIKFEAAPWTPSTKGTVTGSVFSMKLPENPTEAELTAYLNSVGEKVKGGIVMTAAWQYVPVDFNEPQKRRPDDQVKAQYGPPNPNAPSAGGRGRWKFEPGPRMLIISEEEAEGRLAS